MTTYATQTSGQAANTETEQIQLQSEILAAFQGKIQPVHVPITYRLGILLVAFVMILLPILYLGLTLLVCYIVYYHIVHDTALLGMGVGRIRFFMFLAYLAPVIIGGILILFMFKPLFSRPAKPPQRQPLQREKEPLLFAFVEQVCTAVGAPKPKRIELDAQVNASASFRRGFLSMFGNDLVLTIGLPLVAGLTLQEFAGVLAHEFGHFAQGAGMRLTFIIRSISHWFTRVVYERDEWDARLVEWSETMDARVGWIVYLSRFFVWLTRKVLWLLMAIGHAVSGYMLRQMEFDADRHEARLSGSDSFETTMRKVVHLSVAARGAYSDLDDFYREGRLGDNLPKLILHNITQFTPQTHQQINESLATVKTSLFDTHPNSYARIASARNENAAGVFHIDYPATIVFPNFESQCEAVTWEFYESVFGERVHRQDIHALDTLLNRQKKEQESFKALNRYLQGSFLGNRSFPLHPWHLVTDKGLEELLPQVKTLRAQMLQDVAGYSSTNAQLAEATSELQQQQLKYELTSFEAFSGQRLLTSLQLLDLPEAVTKVAQTSEWKVECERLLPILKVVEEQVDALNKLHAGNSELTTKLQRLSRNRGEKGYVDAVLMQRDHNLSLIQQIQRHLNSVEYPFEHAQGPMMLSEFTLQAMPYSDDLRAVYQAAERLIHSCFWVRARLIGQLCLIAEQTEGAFGLESLSEPKNL